MLSEKEKFNRLSKQSIKLEKAMKKQIEEVYQEALDDITGRLSVLDKKGVLTRTEFYKRDRNIALEKAIKTDIQRINNIHSKGIANYGADTYSLNYFQSGFILESEYQQKLGYATIKKANIIKSIQSPMAQISLKANRDAVIDAIRRDITKGILQGQSLTEMSRNVSDSLQKNANNAFKIVQTETTRISGQARQDSFKHAANRGLPIQKEWVAVFDGDTRDAHGEADGQKVDIDKPFIVDGEELMHPGDPSGSAGNVINCRCDMVTSIKGFENAFEYRKARDATGKNKIIPYTNFKEWAKKRVS